MKSCIKASSVNIPLVGLNVQRVPGWTDHVKEERDRSLFWHCIWLEAGNPFEGFIYEIMKLTFVYLEKAFDRVPREVVRWALWHMGVDEWFICTFMALYTEACTVVRTDARLSESFEVKVGLHLSCKLNLYLSII